MTTPIDELIKEFRNNYEGANCEVGGCISSRMCDAFERFLRTEIEKMIKKGIGKEKTSEDFEKQLDIPQSDYSHGHARGYNQLRKEILNKFGIKE
jgi:hypothetical protein